MRTLPILTQRNIAFLEQALALLETIPESVYASRPANFERGGVGTHLRHVLDHYDAFLDGLEQGRIDYDARARDLATEVESAVARRRLRATIARLRELGPTGETQALWAARELLVVMELGDRGDALASSSASSLGRELQYLVAHTVHHFALIAVALRSLGHELPPDFGVAPSTLRHEESSSGACAR